MCISDYYRFLEVRILDGSPTLPYSSANYFLECAVWLCESLPLTPSSSYLVMNELTLPQGLKKKEQALLTGRPATNDITTVHA